MQVLKTSKEQPVSPELQPKGATFVSWALLRWAPYLVLLLTGVVYCKSVFNDFTIFDDDFFILKNPLVKDLSGDGIKAIFTSISSGKYQPLTTLFFAIEYKLFGFNPIPFHLNNILLHLFSTFFVFKVAERLSGSRLAGIIVSFLFALHPMHVEEVSWAAERKDMLYAFFYLWAMWVYVRYVDEGFKRGQFVVCLVLFIFSLLSKSEAVTLPLIMLAIDWYRGRKWTSRSLPEKVPFVIFSIVAVVLSLMSKNADGGLGQVSTENYGIVNRAFLVTTIPAFYIVKLVAPFNLSAMHYYPDLHGNMIPWIYYASLPVTIAFVWLLTRIPSMFPAQREVMRKHVIFGISFCVLTMFVMPQLLSVGPSLTPERYTYIPYIGLFYIIAMCIVYVQQRRSQMIALAILGAFSCMFVVQTWLRQDVWKGDELLLSDILAKNEDSKDCSYFYWLRGNRRFERGEIRDAIQDFTSAVNQHPGYVEAYDNRGSAFFQAGDIHSAILDFDSSLRYSPNHAMSYYNRGAGKATLGDFDGALSDFNKFLQMRPNDARALGDRGMVRLSLKDTTGACEDWKKAISLGNAGMDQFAQQLCH